MDKRDKQAFIRTKALENQLTPARDKVLWSRHAVSKLVIENLNRAQVEVALQNCIEIEDYPPIGRPLPDCLVLGVWKEHPIHAVVAIDTVNDRIFVVTVYVPSPERWEDDWQTRKR